MTSETLLVKGNKVEVTSDEEGFGGAWYIATIVKTSSKAQKGKILVEYESLLADDEKSPLKEYIDASLIRPLPPEAKKFKPFEVFDVVDTFFKDGWWKGVISEVRDLGGEDDKKTAAYTVVFENPPDQIEVGPSSLRLHFDWFGGSWVKPRKQKRMKGLKFSKGMVVVVNIDEGSSSNDWFEAVVLEEVGFNSFLVKLSNSEDDNGLMKLVVDSFHIRPPLPNLESENFELLDKVYVLYCSGWRLGFINKILTEGRFSVMLKHLKVEKEFFHSDIRPSMDFVNGSWVHYHKGALFQDTMNGGYSQEYPSLANNNANSLEIAVQLESSSAAMYDNNENTPCTNSEKNPMQHSFSYGATYPRKRRVLTACKKVKKTSPSSEPTLLTLRKKSRLDKCANYLSSLECSAKLLPVETPNQGAEVSSTSQTEHAMNHVAYQQPISEYESPFSQKNDETNQQENVLEDEMMISAEVGSTQPSSQLTSQLVQTAGVLMLETNQPETGVEDEMMVSVEDGGVSPHSQAKSQVVQTADVLVQEANQQETELEDETMISVEEQMPPCSQVEGQLVQIAGVKMQETHQLGTGIEDETMISAEDGGMQTHLQVTSQLDLTAVEEHNVAGVGAINTDLENPASKEFKLPTGLVESVGMLVCQRETLDMRQQVEMIAQYPQMDASVDGELAEHQLVPFLRNSPVWDMVESLEVFQRMPQKPHFNPLVKCKEFDREGSAIGKMVQFATVVEKTSELQLGDPLTVFNSYLETLADLKSYGFDVEAVVYRINGLLSIKESQEQLQSTSKQVEIQIAECTRDRTKLEEDIEAVNKKIRKLEEERGLALSMKESRESEITNLQMQSSGISADISKAILDFEALATASW
ncbi:unnamed protein product [Dovyalis caffra]|uniref:Agenet domain-containing protein n=1 Tax=Dovyalis caffra TaxID=77055 RepID=A0AAV1RUW0_9ROSI|nr:unnamed protein product [Dovyalis caffra]